MNINKVAPYEGNLVWVGETRTGVSRSGKEWASVDYTVRYSDGDRERYITFNAFGADKVGQLMALPNEARIRVTWEPDTRESNGKWWPKLATIEIKEIGGITSGPGTELPEGAVLHPRTHAPTFPNPPIRPNGSDDNSDLPF